jgi:hypothetical protein
MIAFIAVFTNTVAIASPSPFETRRVVKKLAGDASHRFNPQCEPPLQRSLRKGVFARGESNGIKFWPNFDAAKAL